MTHRPPSSPAKAAGWSLRPVAILITTVAVGVVAFLVIGLSASSPFRGAGVVGYPEACQDVETLGLTWYYTWTDDLACLGTEAEFVPMVWGDWCDEGSDCSVLPDELVARGESVVLGFNEPDWHEQADLSVDRALELWSYLDATSLRLGSPAVTSGPRGSAWLEEFMRGAVERDLRVDFLAVHWYGDCGSTDELRAYLTSKAEYGLPLWLTEFACEDEPQEVNERFLLAAADVLAEFPGLQRVAWFANRPYQGYEGGALMDEAGDLTSVGSAYLEVPTRRRGAAGTG